MAIQSIILQDIVGYLFLATPVNDTPSLWSIMRPPTPDGSKRLDDNDEPPANQKPRTPTSTHRKVVWIGLGLQDEADGKLIKDA